MYINEQEGVRSSLGGEPPSEEEYLGENGVFYGITVHDPGKTNTCFTPLGGYGM